MNDDTPKVSLAEAEAAQRERRPMVVDLPAVDTNATTEPKLLEAGWISRAPRRVDFAVESTVVVNEATLRAYPGVAFAFGGGSDEPVTVVFVGSPDNMTLLAKHIKRAAEDARRGSSHARAELEKRRLEVARAEAEAEKSREADGDAGDSGEIASALPPEEVATVAE